MITLLQLGDFFLKERIRHGLSLGDLARQVGYQEAWKGAFLIHRFERQGEIERELLGKLANALKINAQTVNGLIEEDLQAPVPVGLRGTEGVRDMAISGMGYWLNPLTATYFPVTTHEQWIYDRHNAQSIFLPDHLYQQIRKHNLRQMDEIRTIAVKGGLVRIRDHGNRTAVQFWDELADVRITLRAILRFFDDIKADKYTELWIHNLADDANTVIPLDELRQKLEQGQPVLGEPIA